MPTKRGRPVLADASDERVVQRRRATAQRTREYRSRQTQQAIPQNTTTRQLQQGEQIISFIPTETEAASLTFNQLGLRVQGLAVAQDSQNSQSQQGATAVNEHDILYRRSSPNIVGSQSSNDLLQTQASSSSQSRVARSNIASFFHPIPTPNPFTVITPTIPQINLAVTENEDVNPRQPPRTPSPDLELDVGEEGQSLNSIIQEENVVTVDEDPNRDFQDNILQVQEGEVQEQEQQRDEEQEITAIEYTKNKLFEQFQLGHHGCSPQKHEEQLRKHNIEVGEHYGLDEIHNEPNFPSILGIPEMISSERLNQQSLPSPRQWQAMFCGIPSNEHLPYSTSSRRPKHVCLHMEETQENESRVAYDVDSFLGFSWSLAMARQGIWLQPVPNIKQNITKDIHIQTRRVQPQEQRPETEQQEDEQENERIPRSTLAMLRDVPHFQLGRVEGAHDISIYVLFPHLEHSSDRFQALTKEQLTRWLDRVFMPAIEQYCEAHYIQHFPADFEHAYTNSRAHQVEGRQIETTSYQAQQALGYHLQPECLDLIWTRILDTISTTPGLFDFRDAQLFFSAKGTKLQFKTSPSRPTLLNTIENFQSYFERIMDLNFVDLDRLYIDIGKEICPQLRPTVIESRNSSVEAQTYIWKRCCLESYMNWMYDEKPPKLHSRGQCYYHRNMLYESCTLTSLTPKKSKLRQGGLIYSQFYSSVKEVWDATNLMPFTNDGLEEMALDLQIRQGARHATGGRRRDSKIIERAYCASKKRAHHGLLASRRKSFGIREEHRISWSLFQALLEKLQVEAEESELRVLLTECPSYTWAIKTNTFLGFLWRSVNKYAAGFELVRARCRPELVTWEQTKMMAMFLRGLRFVLGGNRLEQESALWWSRRDRRRVEDGDQQQQNLDGGNQRWYGLGFCNTLPRYKYCWIEPRIDWVRLQFQSNVTDEVLFGNNTLKGQYLRRGRQTREFLDTTRRLELALGWIERYHENSNIRERLLGWMIDICLQQFRIDILQAIKGEIKEEKREEALKGEVGFCYEYFEEIMDRREIYLISGNRCDFKQPSELGSFLFEWNDGLIRKHWEDKPFRKLYRRARTALGLIRRDASSNNNGEEPGDYRLDRMFKRGLYRQLLGYHWILPYPCGEVLLQTTKQGARMWYSIEMKEEVRDEVREGMREGVRVRSSKDWIWKRKGWRSGRVDEIAGGLFWEKEKWKKWIEREWRR